VLDQVRRKVHTSSRIVRALRENRAPSFLRCCSHPSSAPRIVLLLIGRLLERGDGNTKRLLPVRDPSSRNIATRLRCERRCEGAHLHRRVALDYSTVSRRGRTSDPSATRNSPGLTKNQRRELQSAARDEQALVRIDRRSTRPSSQGRDAAWTVVGGGVQRSSQINAWIRQQDDSTKASGRLRQRQLPYHERGSTSKTSHSTLRSVGDSHPGHD